MTNTTPRTREELDALLTRELVPLMERLASEHSVVVTAVCVAEDTGVTSVVSCMTSQTARAALESALAAYQRDNHDA